MSLILRPISPLRICVFGVESLAEFRQFPECNEKKQLLLPYSRQSGFVRVLDDGFELFSICASWIAQETDRLILATGHLLVFSRHTGTLDANTMCTPNYRKQLATAALLLALFGCEKEPETDVATILERHTEARGGRAALEAVQALEVNRRVEEGAREFTTHYIATRDGRMRLDVYQDREIIFSEGYDGKSAWQRRGRSAPADEMPDWAAAAVKRALRHNLYALHELAATGTQLTLAERERVAGGLYNWVIEATDPDGYKRRLFLSPNNFLVTRVQENSALNPDQSNYPSQLETHFSDFREVEGVYFSFKSETFSDDAGQAVQTTIANEIIVNPEFDPAVFSRPEDDAADSDQNKAEDDS